MDTTKEQKAIDYLRSQLDMGDPKTVLVVYSQIIEQDVFHTQVGFDFLQELKDYLTATPVIDNEEIPDFYNPAKEPPPAEFEREESDLSLTVEVGAVPPAPAVTLSPDILETPDLFSEPEAAPVAAPEEAPRAGTGSGTGAKEKSSRKKRVGLFRRTQKEVATPAPGRTEGGSYRLLFLYSVFVNLVLIVMVIAMFVLTLTSDSPNIINYRTKLEDEYASWDEELTKREQELRKWEQELSETQQELEGELYVDQEYEP